MCISWRFIILSTNHHLSLPADNAQCTLTHTIKNNQLYSVQFLGCSPRCFFPTHLQTVGQSGLHFTSAAPPIMSCCCDCQLQHRLKEELSGGRLQENPSEQCKKKKIVICLNNVKYIEDFLLKLFVGIFLEIRMQIHLSNCNCYAFVIQNIRIQTVNIKLYYGRFLVSLMYL